MTQQKITIDPNQLTTHDGKPLKFYGGQISFIKSLVPRVALLGGFGSGKTLPFCFKALVLAFLNGRGYRGLLVSPTYDMMQRVLIPTIRDDLLMKLGDPDNGKSLWDLSSYSVSNRCLTLPNGFEIYFGSADNPTRTRGANLAFVGLDEAAMVDKFEEMYISGTSRLRRARPHKVTGKPMSQFFLATTPEGLDKVYEKFAVPPEDPALRDEWESTHQIIRISTLENPGITNEFLRDMMIGIPEPLIPAYLHGLHVDIGRGLCYYNFSRDKNISSLASYDPDLELYLSFDFGSDPAVLTIHQLRAGSVVTTIDEIFLRNASTIQVVLEFIRRYGTQGLKHRKRIIVTGDATDAVGVSNYDEIMDYLAGHFVSSEIRRAVKASNPRHYRRLKSVNALAQNAAGEIRYYINPKCTKTIRDFLSQRMMPNGLQKDKKQEAGDGTFLGHCSDTVDYLVDMLFPFRRRNTRDALRGSSFVSHVA